MHDKTMHDTIARRIRQGEQCKNALALKRFKPVEHIRTPREPLPLLTPPKRGVYPMPGQISTHSAARITWSREQWWRFKRACYAQEKRAQTMLREFMQKTIDDYERTLK
jgi:hypothetical protein